MTTFSACLTNLKSLLLQSRDCSCYVSTPILAPPPLLLQKHTDLRAHEFAHSLRFVICLVSSKVTAPEVEDFIELILI